MTTTKQILMAIVNLFYGVFALLTPAAQRGGDKGVANVVIECRDEDAGKDKPYQQVCPEGAACNQGVH